MITATNKQIDRDENTSTSNFLYITLTWPHWGNHGECNLFSIKCMKRGHGDTALNLHLQVHQRLIQINLLDGQGRWGERQKDLKDSVRPEKTDTSISSWFAQRETVLSLYKNIHIPQFDLSTPFSLSLHFLTDQTKALKKQSSKTSRSKENSISLIRWRDTNNECAKARLRERCAKMKTTCLRVHMLPQCVCVRVSMS